MSRRRVQVAVAALALVGYSALPAQAEFGAVVVLAGEGLAVAMEIGGGRVTHRRGPCEVAPDHRGPGERGHRRPEMRSGCGKVWIRPVVLHVPVVVQPVYVAREVRTGKPVWANRGNGVSKGGRDRSAPPRDRGNHGRKDRGRRHW